MSSVPGQLLVLSAPSGAGKTTLARAFLAKCPNAVFSISATTRPPRGQERDGVDYQFMSAERFAEMVAQKAFAEWAEVHGHRYGTLRSTAEMALDTGRVALLDIDVQGGISVKALWPREAVTVFVLPPSMAELEARLRGRSTDSEGVIARRLAASRAEIARGAAQYDYLIVNDTIDAALRRLMTISSHERALRTGAVDPESRGEAERWARGSLDVTPWLHVPGSFGLTGPREGR